MAELLQEYGKNLKQGQQELVSLNKAQLACILKGTISDVEKAYRNASDTSIVKQYLQRIDGRLATLVALFDEVPSEQASEQESQQPSETKVRPF